MMMKRLLLSIVAVAFMVCAGVAQAADVKIAVIDMQQIMSKSKQAEKLRGDLEKRFGPKKAELQKSADAFKADVEKLKKNDAVMSKADKEKLQKKITDAQQDLQQRQYSLQQEAMQAQNEALQSMIDNVRNAVKKLAASEKYTIVLAKEAAIFDENLDITDKVMKALADK
jgi:outer membrane protein